MSFRSSSLPRSPQLCLNNAHVRFFLLTDGPASGRCGAMSFCVVARASGWCPLCYSGLRGRRVYSGHYGQLPVRMSRWRKYMSGLKRAPKPVGPVSSPSPAGEPACRMELPTLTDFLILGTWPDGARRLLGTASLFWEDGSFKLWLNDKDGLRCCCISSPSMEGLFTAADSRLASDDLEWRRARPDAGRARGK